MSQIQGWLNTSATKNSIWVKPKGGILNESVFINLENAPATTMLANLLREAYQKKVSFEMTVNLADIKRSKNGAAFVSMTLAQVLDLMVKSERIEAKVDEKAAAKAAAILAELGTLPTPAPTAIVLDEVFATDFE